MSENGVFKELGLEKYFWTIIDSSQDGRSSSSSSFGRKSLKNEDEIENKRGEAVKQEEKKESQEKAQDIPQIRILANLTTPSPHEKKLLLGSPSLFNTGTPQNGLISHISFSTSGGRTPNINFDKPQLDATFMAFDPSLCPSTEKHGRSYTSVTKANTSTKDSLTKAKSSPGNGTEDNKFRKQRSNSLDEADFALISQMLEEEARKSHNEEGVHSVKSLPIENISSPAEAEQGNASGAAAGGANKKASGFLMPILQTPLKPITINQKSTDRYDLEEIEKLLQSAKNSQDEIDRVSKSDSALKLPNPLSIIPEYPTIQEEAESLMPALQTFNQDNFQEGNSNLVPSELLNQNASEFMMPTLQTASMKPITFNPESLNKVQSLFADDENNDSFFKPTKNLNNSKNVPYKTNNLLKATNQGSNVIENPEIQNGSESVMPILQTASMKPLTFNQENLARIQSLFAEDENNEDFFFKPSKNLQNGKAMMGKNGTSLKVINKSSPVPEVPPIQNGGAESVMPTLQTASMKPITFNQESLNKVQSLFADDENNDNFFKPTRNFQNSKPLASKSDASLKAVNKTSPGPGSLQLQNGNSVLPTLQTASMKPITFNQESLNRVQSLFVDDENNDSFFKPGKNFQNNNKSTFSKNGNTLKVTNQTSHEVGSPTPGEFIMPTLQTASMKPLTFNQENLARIQNLFADDENADNVFLKPTKKVQNGKFLVSKGDTLARVTNLFKDTTVNTSKVSKENSNSDKELRSMNENFSSKAALKPGYSEKSVSFRDPFLQSDKDPIIEPEAQFTINNNKANNTNYHSKVMSKSVGFHETESFLEENDLGLKNNFAKSTKDNEAMEIEPKLMTASMKPINFDAKKLKQIQDMFEENSQDDSFLPGGSIKFNPNSILKVENNASFKLSQFILKEDKVDTEPIDLSKFSLKSDSNKPNYNVKKPNLDQEQFSQVLKIFLPEDKTLEKANPKKSVTEINGKSSPPLIKVNLFEDTKDSPDTFEKPEAKNKNSDDKCFLQTGNGRRVNIDDKDLDAAFKFFLGDSQDDQGLSSTSPPKGEIIENKENKETSMGMKSDGESSMQAMKKIFRDDSRMTFAKENNEKSLDLKSDDLSNMQVTKKVLRDDLRNFKSPNKIQLSLSNTTNTKMEAEKKPITKNIPEQKEGSKKNQLFKFTKENGDNSLKVPVSKPDKSSGLKRNYKEFSKESEISMFKENLKIQAFIARQPSKVKSMKQRQRKTYFFKENIVRGLKDVPIETGCLSINDCLEKKFICPCANLIQSQQGGSPPLESNDFSCCCDGSLLIGWKEARDELLKQGLEKEYVTEEWVKNHYRMIVWKLASIERTLLNYHYTKQLTFNNVKMELEYRYFIERVEGKRSVLQRIIEKDEFATAHLILLVGEIISQTSSYLVELTDGWYSVYLEVKREAMIKNCKSSITNNQLYHNMIKSKKLYSGMKVHVIGMKLVETKQGTPSADMKPKRTHVEIDYNSIAKARWDAKLGRARTQAYPKNLASLRSNGGLVPMIDVFVLKKYKLLERTSNGLRQYQSNEGTNTNTGKVILKLKVADAIIYYLPNCPQKFKDVICEVEITSNVWQADIDIKEGERVRFYNLKVATKNDRKMNFYDHENNKFITHSLYLQLQGSAGMYQLYSQTGVSKQEVTDFKEFVKKNYKPQFLLSSVDLNTSKIAFYQKNIKICKNEIDALGIVLHSTPAKLYGCLSNGHFFQILLHSGVFFANIKILDKKNSNIINFRSLQLDGIEKLDNGETYCFILRTSELTSFATHQSPLFQDETEKLSAILKNKVLFEEYQEKVNTLMKKV